jgi:hypothetical protein
MFFNLRNRMQRGIHAARCKGIWTTPPVAAKAGGTPLIFLSQITRRDLLMYLVAIKSIATQVGFGQIVQVDDNSLTEEDLALLQRHLPGSRCIPIRTIDTGHCPRGGTWERLCHILDLAQESYVVQVDADTLVCGEIPEVVDCITQNRAFTLGTRQGQKLVSLAEAASFVREFDPHHIQIAAERALASIPDGASLKYVRGSSGFAGFARGGFDRARLETFSQQMARSVGEQRWREWGTEQVSSSFVVANSPNAVVLPHPKYACFDLDMNPDQAAFLHFIGTNRFDAGVYAAKSRAAIARLNAR